MPGSKTPEDTRKDTSNVAPDLPAGEDSRGCIAEVDLDAIVTNFKTTMRLAGGGPAAICTVKANAYGHGGAVVAAALKFAGAHGFGVVTLEEAQQLRDAGVEGPILLVGGASWWRSPERLQTLGAIPILASAEEVEALNRVAVEAKTKLRVHIGIDTGLSREGFYVGNRNAPDLTALQDALAGASALDVEGAMTHFMNADLADEVQSEEQVAFFSEVVGALRTAGHAMRVTHFANSAAALRGLTLSKAAPTDVVQWVRPGICLYGVTPFGDGRNKDDLRPALSWRAPVVARKRVRAQTPVSYGATFVTERETELAVLGVGYADGLPRHVSGKGEVMFGESRAPILGRVCMDLTVVDVTDIIAAEGEGICALGAPAWLLGGPSANGIRAEEVAAAADTIGYEIVVRVGSRVPRVYRGTQHQSLSGRQKRRRL